MLYPELQSKIRIIKNRFPKLGNRSIAAELKSLHGLAADQSTIGRQLNNPDAYDERQQTDLIKVLCELVKRTANVSLSVDNFKVNNILSFCEVLGIDKLEAVYYLGKRLHIPEIFLDSLFSSSPDVNKAYVGHYLLFRHDKDKDKRNRPYIQACAEILEDSHGLPMYRDIWDGDDSSQSYTGYVFFVGTILNIVGESRSSRGVTPRPEIWWCGLEVRRDTRTGAAAVLFGYVSDIGRKVGLFTDRIVLVRVGKQEWERVQNDKEFYVARDRVTQVAKDAMTKYLDDWKNLPVRPRV